MRINLVFAKRERERVWAKEIERYKIKKKGEIKKEKNIGSAKNAITQFETAIKCNGDSRTFFSDYPAEKMVYNIQ